ncbi:MULTISPECIES: hypothetical protein [Streptomyces]|uniref:hypothetical protein n=1 Tax=Streptomyces herbicida TaxID=3065675 RepID=UPI0029314200|nr:hypothetical protein [Streptomyces sp. NEAU-HV9]
MSSRFSEFFNVAESVPVVALKDLEDLAANPASAAMWESQVLAHVRRTGADPTYDDIPDKVVQPQVQGPDAALRLAARRKGTLRAGLEKRYHDLEKRVDQFQLLLRF